MTYQNTDSKFRLQSEIFRAIKTTKISTFTKILLILKVAYLQSRFDIYGNQDVNIKLDVQHFNLNISFIMLLCV